jgi:acetyl esterase
MAVEVDPEILAARAAQAARFSAFDVSRMPPAEGRARANEAAGMFNDGLPGMARVEDHDVEGMRLRAYVPREVRARGGIYYLHGGGWFACDVDTHDRMLRLLAEEAGAVLFAADYRHAPEHPYPAPLDDAAKGWDWIEAHASGYGADPGRFAFAGDSAGANLALALMLRLRDTDRAMPAGGALIYGCFAPGLDTESARTFGAGGYGLTDERMQWYWANYLGGSEAVEAMPLHAELAGLPPLFLGIAEADTVADDSRLLRARLEAAGAAAALRIWPGAVHGFLQMSRDVGLARDAIGEVAQAVRAWIA